MLAMIVGTIRAGLGCEIIDPHGTLIAQCLQYIPEDRLRDVVYVDPTNSKVPGIGYFDTEDTELATRITRSSMEARSGKGYGPRTAEIFRGAGDTAQDAFKRPTILEIYKILSDDAYAMSLMENSKNFQVRDFYEHWYAKDVKKRDRLGSSFSPTEQDRRTHATRGPGDRVPKAPAQFRGTNGYSENSLRNGPQRENWPKSRQTYRQSRAHEHDAGRLQSQEPRKPISHLRR